MALTEGDVIIRVILSDIQKNCYDAEDLRAEMEENGR